MLRDASTSRPCERRDPYGADSRFGTGAEVFFTSEARGDGPCVRRDDQLRDCASPRFKFSNGNIVSKHTFATPRREAPGSCKKLSAQRGRGERRAPVAPAASCALGIGKKHTSKRVPRNHPTFPHAMVLTVSFALPGDRACLPPSLSGYVLSKPGWADLNSANLTPASGRQDHATSPYATTSFVSSPFDRSQVFQLALPSRCAPNAAASTASHPASLTIRIRPLWDGMRKF